MRSRNDTAGVIAAPPLLFGAALIVGLLLHATYPIRVLPVASVPLRLAGAALMMLVVQRGVVRREERYLEAKFGQDYRDYMARVPRWLGPNTKVVRTRDDERDAE